MVLLLNFLLISSLELAPFLHTFYKLEHVPEMFYQSYFSAYTKKNKF